MPFQRRTESPVPDVQHVCTGTTAGPGYAARFSRPPPVSSSAAALPAFRARRSSSCAADAPRGDCRRRSIRSTTSAWLRLLGRVELRLPCPSLRLIIFIRFSRYSSVYCDGSHSSARFSTSVLAI